MAEHTCELCNGKGEIPCEGCLDSLKGARNYEKDSSYETKHWASCARCHGRGTLTCPECKGSGKIGEDKH